MEVTSAIERSESKSKGVGSFAVEGCNCASVRKAEEDCTSCSGSEKGRDGDEGGVDR